MARELPRDRLLEILTNGEIALSGQFAWGSNHTYLADVGSISGRIQAIYKPASGERPLWDFPRQTLAQREVAAYLTSQALGLDLVPPTVLRQAGPGGPGSLQLYLDIDPERHYFTFSEREKQLLPPVALFDALANNADRKAGHVLLSTDDRIHLIDHGLCFHVEHKLRTVIWDFAGEPIPASMLEALNAFRSRISNGLPELQKMLSEQELEALAERAQRLMETEQFPTPGAGRNYPWPLI
jgi:hypothetical protein